MKTFLFKISAFALAILVLFSTFSFTVDKHYCGDFLVDVSFTGETEGCGMNMDVDSQVKKSNCCKDEVHKFEGQDELQTSKLHNITFEKGQFLTAFLVSYADLFTEVELHNEFYHDFSPPDIPFDYQISYQTFLI